jgi:opacity protein-like surface antigen
MLKVIVTAVFAAAVPLATAFAADMPVPVMPAQVQPVSSWYLRGDVGVSAVHADGVNYLANPANPPSDFTIQSVGIGDQAFLNAGIGYEVNNWLRLDVTGEYRTKAAFNFWGGYTTACPNPFAQCLDVSAPRATRCPASRTWAFRPAVPVLAQPSPSGIWPGRRMPG